MGSKGIRGANGDKSIRGCNPQAGRVNPVDPRSNIWDLCPEELDKRNN